MTQFLPSSLAQLDAADPPFCSPSLFFVSDQVSNDTPAESDVLASIFTKVYSPASITQHILIEHLKLTMAKVEQEAEYNTLDAADTPSHSPLPAITTSPELPDQASNDTSADPDALASLFTKVSKSWVLLFSMY